MCSEAFDVPLPCLLITTMSRRTRASPKRELYRQALQTLLHYKDACGDFLLMNASAQKDKLSFSLIQFNNVFP
jgi:hypothetical protein